MKLLALLILLVCPNVQAATTLDGIRADVRSLITDAQAVRQRFSNAELDSWANEGQKLADVKTLCVYRRYNFSLVAGTTYYAMPDGFLSVRRLTRDKLSIQEMTPAALDGRSAEWENASGLPTYYFINFSTRGVIGFAPFPNAAGDIAQIGLDYFSYSNPLVSATDPVFNGIGELQPFTASVSFYTAYKASIIDERYDKAKVFMDSFTSITDLMKTSCVRRENYLPSAIGKSQ